MINWMERGLWGVVAVIGLWVLAPQQADATPIYSIRSVNACDTCHIEPLGWANPDMADRFCTLDCNGCHYSPTGGGLRTPTGQYYGEQVLSMFGERPGDFADPEKYRPEGYPKKGRYRLGEGFSGWWAGNIPMRDITDRFGDIDPDPKFKVGFDARIATVAPLEDGDRELAVFPMQADLHVMGRPVNNLVLYSSLGLKGRKEGLEDAEALDYLIVREVFAKLDRLPNNSYIRVGRFTPPFGWRQPDHTILVRTGADFINNEYQVYGIEGGYNPNYFFANAAAFYQGLDAWPGDLGDEGFGGALTTGYRDLGWQAFGSLKGLSRTDGPSDVAVGAGWGLNLYPVTYIGEMDFKRTFSDNDNIDDSSGIFAYHEVDWLITRGLTGLVKYDWQDPNLTFKDDHFDRYTVGLRLEPYTFTQLDLQYRTSFLAGDSATSEVIIILHGWM